MVTCNNNSKHFERDHSIKVNVNIFGVHVNITVPSLALKNILNLLENIVYKNFIKNVGYRL